MIKSVLVIVAALVTGMGGAQGCHMFNAHNAQHKLSDTDHQLLQQLAPAVQQLVQIEQQRRQSPR